MSDKTNLVLIVLDCLRKDYEGPVWDELKNLDFKNYNRAVCTASWTMPSHASMFTGLYPSMHGVHETPSNSMENITFQGTNLVNVLRERIHYLLGDGKHLCLPSVWISQR